MRPARPLLTATALPLALVLSLGACSSTDSKGVAEAKGGDTFAIASPSAEPTPAESAPFEPLTAKMRNPNATLGGIVSWRTGSGVTEATTRNLGKKDDAFLTDHMLRLDRWSGSHLVKAGELDLFRKKTTPALADQVEGAHVSAYEFLEKYGRKRKSAPKEAIARFDEDINNIGRMWLNFDTVDGGKGPIRYEITSKSVFIASKALNWSGPALGKPITWVDVKTRRMNNSGTGKQFTLWQAWTKTDDGWRIFLSNRQAL